MQVSRETRSDRLKLKKKTAGFGQPHQELQSGCRTAIFCAERSEKKDEEDEEDGEPEEDEEEEGVERRGEEAERIK